MVILWLKINVIRQSQIVRLKMKINVKFVIQDLKKKTINVFKNHKKRFVILVILIIRINAF